jgi:hypothetical protein
MTMNRDKKNFILVCKEFAIVGTPLLYKHMTVSIEALNDEFASTLSNSENHCGLEHVRTLCIGGGINDTESFHPSARNIEALCAFLSAIPEDILESFRYVECVSVSHPKKPLLTVSTVLGNSKMISSVTGFSIYSSEHNTAYVTIGTTRSFPDLATCQTQSLMQPHWSTSQACTSFLKVRMMLGGQRVYSTRYLAL